MYCKSLVQRDFSSPVLLYDSFKKKSSLFSSLDQCPRTLLNDLTGGGVARVHAHMRMCQDRLPSISQRAVNMGIDKGKGISHLYKGRRPIPLTSSVNRSESRMARTQLTKTLEFSGRYTHSVFSYRAEIRPAYMALVTQAVLQRTLRKIGHVSMAD